jgi:hypothetical protein
MCTEIAVLPLSQIKIQAEVQQSLLSNTITRVSTAVMQLINGFGENGNAIPTQIEQFVLDMEIN